MVSKPAMLDLRELKEVAMAMSNQQAGSHALLRPKNLELASWAEAAPRRVGGEVEDDEDDSYYLFWDELEVEEVPAAKTWTALWQILRVQTPEDVLAVVREWGMPSCDWDGHWRGDRFGDRTGSMSVETWLQFAHFVELLVGVLVMSNNEELVPISVLEEIQVWQEPPTLPEYDLSPDFTDEEMARWMNRLNVTSVTEAIQASHERSREHQWSQFLLQRQNGSGVALQKSLLASQLDAVIGMQYMRFTWDDRGRRMTRDAYGLEDIILSHVADLFQADVLDVHLCSICGTPFPTTEGRRPRFGAQRFCSDECRAEGKRRSNRLSWQRNGTRWRKGSRLAPEEREDDGKAPI